MHAIGLNPGIRKSGAHTWAAKVIPLIKLVGHVLAPPLFCMTHIVILFRFSNAPINVLLHYHPTGMNSGLVDI